MCLPLSFLSCSLPPACSRAALPPGSGSLHGMRGGPSAGQRPITLVWGLTRHEWGDLHFYVAVALMGVLALHLLQHWRWIAARVQGQSGRGSGWRAALGIVGLVAKLSIAAVPFLSPKEQVAKKEFRNGAHLRSLWRPRLILCHTATQKEEPMMNEINRIKVWDPVVRVFHWSLVLAFAVAYFTEEDTLGCMWRRATPSWD